MRQTPLKTTRIFCTRAGRHADLAELVAETEKLPDRPELQPANADTVRTPGGPDGGAVRRR